jgi:hypothetical protein
MVSIPLIIFDWAILFVYFGFIIWIGFYLKKFTKTDVDFFLAGRRNLGTGTGNGIELVQLTGEVTSVQMDNKIPGGYGLSQNYPNLFNPTTTIDYSLQKTGLVTIKIYDAIGRYVKTLVNTKKYSVQFSANGGSASGRNGSNLSSGVYFYRMQSGNFSQTKKLILLK